jgi:two-component system, cell cycle response regulator
MSNEASDPELVLRETRARFIASFRERCEQIRSLCVAESATEREDAVRRLHKMAGLAGTIGFARVSAEAGRLENAVREADASSAAALPLMDALLTAFARDLSGSAPAFGAGASATPLTVLLVEDDADQRDVVGAYLRHAGHTVIELDSGDRVLPVAHEEKPGLILLDLNLPDIDGHEICRRLKADPRLASIPVVFLSGEHQIDQRLAGLALGADEFLVKPIDPRELLLRLQRLHQRANPLVEADTSEPLTYERFCAVARDVLQRERAAVALLRASGNGPVALMNVLRHEVRRRDILAEYDRHHVVLLLPDATAIAARDRLAAIIQLVSERGDEGVAAGIAAAGAAGERSLEALLAEADEALTGARYRGVPVGLKADSARVARYETDEGPVVLVGDDDPDVSRIVDAHLGAAGYRRVLTFDGATTLEQLQVHRPAVLVLDLMMPRVTGFDVLKKIRERGETPPKILVLSARGREDDVTRAFDLGADDYMSKPFNPHELVARVARLLR